MRIGVIGAGGRLGGFMIDTIFENGFSVTAISSKRQDVWPKDISFVAHSDRSDYSALGPIFLTLDIVIIAASLASTAVHELALKEGCHVIDVSVSENHIRACLTLDDLARSAGKCLVVMAGLAPGLMGLLAAHALKAFPTAKTTDLCLIQSVKGSAGEQGTGDMLDMLTDKARSKIIECSVATNIGLPTTRVRAYSFPTVEKIFLSDLFGVSYSTKFDRAYLNSLLIVLRGIRDFSPKLYRSIRNRVARQKRFSEPSADERILLSAVAKAEDERTLGVIARSFKSDYGATSAIALALADLAYNGKLKPAAGHPRKFTNWKELAAHPIVRREEVAHLN